MESRKKCGEFEACFAFELWRTNQEMKGKWIYFGENCKLIISRKKIGLTSCLFATISYPRIRNYGFKENVI
ncbi:hypothetical protein NEF87_005071 [Candidatus Lokiarchaeum ossiferum]|uniref:Uncharacterized protein n=1 Tax=Candidatus Lokiarchaeum ossiferum TaxID=2951803 RepID=A0ABY6HZN8_9ARCH|nr:hypothetical protein NEF87_005071 [Candidatus Lokiarchaeum sp. B-35]